MFIAYTALTSYWFNWSLRRSDSKLKRQLVGPFRLIRSLTCLAEVGFPSQFQWPWTWNRWWRQTAHPLGRSSTAASEVSEMMVRGVQKGLTRLQRVAEGLRQRGPRWAPHLSAERGSKAIGRTLPRRMSRDVSSDSRVGCVSIFGTNQHERADSVALYQRFKLLLAVW